LVRVKKGLRSGYTTGACAAAAAKAAVLELIDFEAGVKGIKKTGSVEIPFPDGSRVKFRVQSSGVRNTGKNAWASVIKDAGDDPDVTNGAEIVAEVTSCKFAPHPSIVIKRGKGVGVVTKPGLPVPVGEAAINPVPKQMIKEAVLEAVNQRSAVSGQRSLEITISVPNGEELAKKTLNSRLGILGGISILGTTGIVKPVSTEAWRATITSSMDVARAIGLKEIILSAGRTSERAHMKANNLSEASYVLMGDYLEYSLKETRKQGFKRVHLCAQWAKMLKIAMATPQTHVRFGAINIKKAALLLNSLDINVPAEKDFNTAREIFDFIKSEVRNPKSEFIKVCNIAGRYAEGIAGIPVNAVLISYTGEIIAESE